MAATPFGVIRSWGMTGSPERHLPSLVPYAAASVVSLRSTHRLPGFDAYGIPEVAPSAKYGIG
jgi:hypothetical protein